MKRSILTHGLLMIALTAGCAPPGASLAVPTLSVTGHVAPFVLRRLMDTVPTVVPFTLDRVTAIEVWGSDAEASGEQAALLGQLFAQPGEVRFGAVKLFNLQPQHDYVVSLKAYIDDTCVSVGSGSSTAVSTKSEAATNASNEVVQVHGFKLQLADQTWVGNATGDLDVRTGLIDAEHALSFGFPQPNATPTELPSDDPEPPL